MWRCVDVEMWWRCGDVVEMWWTVRCEDVKTWRCGDV